MKERPKNYYYLAIINRSNTKKTNKITNKKTANKKILAAYNLSIK